MSSDLGAGPGDSSPASLDSKVGARAFVGRTRSATIVAEIEQEIVEQGWPIGHMIGHEAQLMERFGISRSVLREAIRTLEHRGVVTVRTGRKGGLVVTEPSSDGIKMASSLYLDYVGFEPSHLYATLARGAGRARSIS